MRILLLASVALAAPVLAEDQPGSPQTVVASYAIPAGPVTAGLNRIAETSGLQISYEAALTENLVAPAVNGQMDAGQALTTLLRGTGLSWRFVDARTVTIVRARRGSMALDPVVVSASAPVDDLHEEQSQAAARTRTRENIIVNGLRPETAAVSGTKLDIPLIETPQSISVVDLDAMRVRNVLSVGDAVAYSSGVFANTKGVTYGGDAIAVRGFGNDGTTGAATNTYVDGLRLGGTGYVTAALDPWLYERIEVVKGPASVLFGQSVPGGLINMISRRPRDVFGGEVLLRYGTYDRKQVGFDITGPINGAGRLLARLSGTAFETHDAYPYSDRKRVLIAPAITWRPGDDTSLTLLAHYQHDDFAGSTLNWLPTIGTVIANPNGRISRKLFTGDPNYQGWDRKTGSIGYEFQHRFGDAVTFSQNFRYTHNRLDNQNTYISRLSADLRTASRQAFGLLEHSDDLTLDSHLAIRFATGRLSHQVLLGLDWQKMDSDTLREFAVAPALDVFAPAYRMTIPPRSPFRNQDYRNRQTGLYAQDQIALDGWRLLLGLRQDWASSYTHDIPSDLADTEKSKALTKRAGLLHLFDNGLAPYVSYSESFTPLSGTDFQGNRFKPEKGKQIEAGLKFQPKGSRSFITASVFDLRRRNVLTTDADNPDYSRQTGEIRMRGFELEANVQLPAGFSVIGAYTLLDPKVTKSNDSVSGIDPATLTTVTRAEQGLRPVAVPRHNASLWLDYAGDKGIGLGAGVRYSSATYGDGANLSRVPAYALVDASLRLDIGHWIPSFAGLELRVKANNVFDKTYVASCIGIDRCYYGQGRNVTADIAFRW